MSNKPLAEYNRQNIQQCETTARDQQKANPSDPFTYERVMAHLLSGVCIVSDYMVRFRNEPRKTESGKDYTIQVPFDQKRP